ncbi:MAG: DUF6597 domain-containing transcriptional factor [Planctomycetota bacterium]
MSWTVGYREYLPAPDLRDRLDCFWVANLASAGPEEESKRVLPDGCADFLFDLQALASGKGGSRCVGSMTRPLDAQTAPGQRLFGLRFRPGGMRGLLSTPMKELRNELVDLRDLGLEASRFIDQLLDAGDEARMLRAAQGWLRAMGAPARDPLIEAAVARIEATHGAVGVCKLAEHLGVSRQHLARRFADQVGLSPKELQRILRMQKSLSMLRESEQPVIAEIALASGYCDQAHMNLEYRALTGSSPGQLIS